MGDGGFTTNRRVELTLLNLNEMTALDELHSKAMEAAFFADLARRRDGDEKRAMELFEQALDLELKVLNEITEPVEPRNSVLYRSAGWLAMDCGRPELAVQLAEKALAAEPHPAIAPELRELLDAANARIRSQHEAEAAAD